MDIRELDYMIDKVDILQVGARNMYNYSLLKELGKVDKPILLKRGLSATIKEFLLSAEYIMLGGNYTRNTMDIAAISFLKNMTHLPIIADPSHATGNKNLIKDLSKASFVAGSDGVMIETHINPNSAWSDARQSIDIETLNDILNWISNNRIK